ARRPRAPRRLGAGGGGRAAGAPGRVGAPPRADPVNADGPRRSFARACLRFQSGRAMASLTPIEHPFDGSRTIASLPSRARGRTMKTAIIGLGNIGSRLAA